MLSHFLDLPRPDLATGILEGSPDTTTLNAHDWDVDPLTAFMPSKPPLARLPLPWEPWEVIFDDARSIKLALADGDSPPLKREESSRWRDALSVMPLLSTQELSLDEARLRRAHLVLAALLHFFVHSTPRSNQTQTTIVIPKSLATPLLSISRLLQLPPVLTYSDTVLYNWTLPDPSRSVSESNIRMDPILTGTNDEAHFYLTSALIELKGAQAVDLLRASMNELFIADATAVRRVTIYLRRLGDVITDLTSTLAKVRTGCSPSIFYNVVRPWLRGRDSFEPGTVDWLFEDDGRLQPFELSGPSAGQSSLIYTLDIFLTIPDPNCTPNSFMERMKSYMPRHHRAFLQHISRQRSQLRDFVTTTKDPELTLSFNHAVEMLKDFRTEHIRVVALYIITQSRSTGRGDGSRPKGTGGTPIIPFLRGQRERTASSNLE